MENPLQSKYLVQSYMLLICSEIVLHEVYNYSLCRRAGYALPDMQYKLSDGICNKKSAYWVTMSSATRRRATKP